ncbi:hypothetical protein DXG01_010632, partial [Tephrocybe rancida]
SFNSESEDEKTQRNPSPDWANWRSPSPCLKVTTETVLLPSCYQTAGASPLPLDLALIYEECNECLCNSIQAKLEADKVYQMACQQLKLARENVENAEPHVTSVAYLLYKDSFEVPLPEHKKLVVPYTVEGDTLVLSNDLTSFHMSSQATAPLLDLAKLTGVKKRGATIRKNTSKTIKPSLSKKENFREAPVVTYGDQVNDAPAGKITTSEDAAEPPQKVAPVLRTLPPCAQRGRGGHVAQLEAVGKIVKHVPRKRGRNNSLLENVPANTMAPAPDNIPSAAKKSLTKKQQTEQEEPILPPLTAHVPLPVKHTVQAKG